MHALSSCFISAACFSVVLFIYFSVLIIHHDKALSIVNMQEYKYVTFIRWLNVPDSAGQIL